MSERKETGEWIAKPDPSWDGEWIVLTRQGEAYRSVAVSFGFECEAKLAAAAPAQQAALAQIEALDITGDQFIGQGPALALRRLREAVSIARSALLLANTGGTENG